MLSTYTTDSSLYSKHVIDILSGTRASTPDASTDYLVEADSFMDQFEDEHIYGLVDPPFDSENRPPEPSPPHTHTPHPTAPHPIAPKLSSTGAADETPVADDI